MVLLEDCSILHLQKGDRICKVIAIWAYPAHFCCNMAVVVSSACSPSNREALCSESRGFLEPKAPLGIDVTLLLGKR